MDSKKILTIIILIIVVALLGFVLYKFGGSGASVNSGLSTAVPSSSAVSEVLGQKYADELRALEDLNMDTAFFSNPTGDNPNGDPVFRSLVDRHEAPRPEPIGRDNPFLPINDAQIVVPLVVPAR